MTRFAEPSNELSPLSIDEGANPPDDLSDFDQLALVVVIRFAAEEGRKAA
jgi:hypothetical protein